MLIIRGLRSWWSILQLLFLKIVLEPRIFAEFCRTWTPLFWIFFVQRLILRRTIVYGYKLMKLHLWLEFFDLLKVKKSRAVPETVIAPSFTTRQNFLLQFAKVILVWAYSRWISAHLINHMPPRDNSLLELISPLSYREAWNVLYLRYQDVSRAYQLWQIVFTGTYKLILCLINLPMGLRCSKVDVAVFLIIWVALS